MSEVRASGVGACCPRSSSPWPCTSSYGPAQYDPSVRACPSGGNLTAFARAVTPGSQARAYPDKLHANWTWAGRAVGEG